MKFFITSIFMICLAQMAFGQSDKITGYYSSNFAILGFFVTQVQLDSDGTFIYDMRGDLSHDHEKGTYSFDKDTVYLNYPGRFVDTCDSKVLWYTTDLNGHRVNYSHKGPDKFYYQSNKLFILDDSGKLFYSKKSDYYLLKHPNMRIKNNE